MNLILEKTNQVKYFTNMKDVFTALRISCSDYDWYISDVETNTHVFTEGWHTGSDLEKVLASKDIQFIWAVCSAFKKGTKFKVTDAPYAEGNGEFWKGADLKPQLSTAEFEIVCWDSSATILIGIDLTMAENFKKAYSDSTELKYAT